MTRLSLLAVLSFATPVLADSFLGRPLVLPPLTIQPQVAWEMLAYRAGSETPGGTAHSAQAGIDVGAAPGLQVGLGASEEISPDVRFDRFAARSVIGVAGAAGVRLDAAMYRLYRANISETGYDLGIGPAVRIPIIPGTLSLISGRNIALPPLGGTDSLAFADDFLTVDLNHSNVTATIGVPIGLMLEPARSLAFCLRSGYRHGWGGGNFSADWVPLGADVLLNIASRFDLVATAEVPGETGSWASFEGLTSLVFFRATLAARF